MIPTVVDYVAPRHDCGMCDGPLRYMSTYDGHYWWKCDDCEGSHTSIDCCDNPTVVVGDHIQLVSMEDDPDPITPGTIGEVVSVFKNPSYPEYDQIGVAWESGRALLLVPQDRFELLYTIAENELVSQL